MRGNPGAPPDTGAEGRTPSLAGDGGNGETRKTAGADDTPRPGVIQAPLTAGELTRALGGRLWGLYGAATCPACNAHGKTLRIDHGARAPMLRCERGCPRRAIVAALQDRGLWRETPPLPRHVPSHQRKRYDRGIDVAWETGRPLEGTPAAAYLEGLRLVPPWPVDFRASPLGFDGGPALLAAVRDGDGIQRGVLVTGLRCGEGGTVTRSKGPRATFATCPADGLAVRLDSPGDDVGLTADLETGLAAQAALRLPVWVGLDRDRLATTILPARCKRIHVLASRDAEAQQRARQAVEGLQRNGRWAFILTPPDGAATFHETLRQQRAA